MGKKRSKIGRYNKISTQKKYELVRFAQSNGMNLRTVFLKKYLDVSRHGN